MISADVHHKEPTFNLGMRTERKRKDSSGWQDAPGGAAMPLLCWKGLPSCGVGQLETGGLSGGGSRHNNPSATGSQLRGGGGGEDEQTSRIRQL